jgi:hypothetical protein
MRGTEDPAPIPTASHASLEGGGVGTRHNS